MNPKWLGFLIFVWLFGVFIGGTYESDMATPLGSSRTTIQYLFSPTEKIAEGTTGKTSFLTPSNWQTTSYWGEWMKVLVWDFPFLKPYDSNANGAIDTAEEHNNDIGVYAGYFVHAFGIVGLAAFLFAMFEFFSNFITW